MTSPSGGEWARARVGVRLNWGGTENEIKNKLERSVQVASANAQRHLNALAAKGEESAEKIGRAYSQTMTRMRAQTRATVSAIDKDLKRLDRDITVHLTLDEGGVMQQLKRLHKEMQAWLFNHPLMVRIEINDAAARARLIELTRSRTVDLNVDVNQRGGVDRAMAGMLSKITSGFASMGASALSAIGSLAKWGGIAGTAVVAAAALVPVLGALGSALASVGIAAGGAAAAGLGAAVVGFAALKTGLSGIGDAFSTAGKVSESAGADAAAQAKQVESAEKSLARAVKDERDAQKDVSRARDDARERLQDLNLELRGSVLSERDAVLSLKEAQRDLAKGMSDGSLKDPLERERAQLRVADAEQRLLETRESNQDLDKEVATANRQGVEGSDEVTAAKERLAEATETVREAQVALNDAQTGSAPGGSADKFAEAMAKLAPNARAFVETALALKPAWDELKKSVQDSLFENIAPQFGEMANTYMPLLESTLVGVAAGFNAGAQSVLAFTNSAEGVSVISTLLEGSGNIAANVGEAIGSLMPGLLAVVAAASNVFSPMTDGFGAMAQGWSDKMVEMQQSGRLDEIFKSAIDVAKQFGAVLGDVGGIISGVFNAASGAGSGVMGTLGQVLDSVNQFVNSVEGQAALGSFFTAMTAAVGAVLPVLMQLATIIATDIAPIIAQLLTSIAPMIGPVLDALSAGITALMPAIEPIVELFADIADAVVPILPVLGELIATFVELAGPILGSLVSALSPIIEAIGNALITALTALMPIMEPIGVLFEALSPIIATLAEQLGTILAEIIVALMPIVTVLAEAFAQVFEAIEPLLPVLGDALVSIIQMLAPLIEQQAGMWMEFVQAVIPLLPPLIQMISTVLPILVDLLGFLLPIIMKLFEWFGNIWLVIVEKVIPIFINIVEAMTKVYEKIGQVIAWLGTLGDKFGTAMQWIKDKVGEAKDWIVEKFTAVVDWVKGLPQRITDAATGMWDGITGAFKGMVNGLIRMWNGLSDKLSFTVPDIPGVPKRGEKIRPIPRIKELREGGRIGADLATRMASGMVRGPGGPRDDMIAGMIDGIPQIAVSNKEMVMNGPATARFFPVLEAMNTGRPFNLLKYLPGLADGGLVGREPYGLPAGTSGSGAIFPPWVHDLEQRFGITASTYAGHQEKDGKNKGIDWSGSTANLQRFAEYVAGIKDQVEQVIWMNPETGEQIGVADGQLVGPGTSQPGYYADDWAGHQDHVHTRQSFSFGGTTGNAPGIDTTGSSSALGSGTPIGSGIGVSGAAAGAGASPSWGNSGGGSQFNSAVDAKAGGITPVWVENWPASIGGSAPLGNDIGADSGTLTADTAGSAAPMEIPDLGPDASEEDVARAIVAEGRARGYTDDEIKAILSTAKQESGLKMVEGGGGAWHGYFQQDESYAQRDDPNGNITGFYDRLDEKRGQTGASGDIWKDIFWLQQRPGEPSANAAVGNGRQAYLDEIQSQKSSADALFDKVASTGAMPVTVVDPPAGSAVDPNAPVAADALPSMDTNYGPSGQYERAGYNDDVIGTADMPFGRARADQWLTEQDYGTQAEQWGVDALKEITGGFLDPFGLSGLFDSMVDQLVTAIQAEQEKAIKIDVTVGGEQAPNTQVGVSTEGMTAVTDTYRRG